MILNVLALPIVEVIIIGALAGLVGVYAVLNNKVFFTESITHGTFPGAVIGVVLGAHFGLDHAGLSLMLFAGATAACVPLSWLMFVLARKSTMSPQSAAGVVLTLGFALGYFLFFNDTATTEIYTLSVVGSVLNIHRTDVLAAAIVFAISLAITARWGNTLIFYAFDRSGFQALNSKHVSIAGRSIAPTALAEIAMLTMITSTIVVLIPAVGTILAIALVAAPAAGLAPRMNSPQALMIAAPIAGVIIGLAGLAVAIVFNLSAGGTIALAAGAFYLGCRLL
nr:metal ABC transporter permease [Corynebacterium argentoratense]